MAFYRKSGGGNVTPTIVKRRSGGAWVTPAAIKRRSGGAWVHVWPPLTASLSQSSIYSSRENTTDIGTVTSGNVTCIASGGTGAAKTYYWRATSPTDIQAVSPNNETTAFTYTGTEGTFTAPFVCDVNDGTYYITSPELTVTLKYTKQGV